MATRFHIGAKELRGSIAAYAKRFDFLEVSVGLAPASTAEAIRTSPALSTLRRWRKEMPPYFDFCVVAGPHLARLKPDEELEKELSAARAAIDALQARCFLLRTPTEVTPAPIWRDRMAKLLARLPRDATHVIWEPSGVWELDEAALSAKRWDIVLSVDAARDPVPPGPIAFTRLRALGETRAYGPSALERVIDAVGERRDAYVVLETATALTEGRTLRQLAQRSRVKGSGAGTGRLIRPHGGILVRDDEQE